MDALSHLISFYFRVYHFSLSISSLVFTMVECGLISKSDESICKSNPELEFIPSGKEDEMFSLQEIRKMITHYHSSCNLVKEVSDELVEVLSKHDKSKVLLVLSCVAGFKEDDMEKYIQFFLKELFGSEFIH